MKVRTRKATAGAEFTQLGFCIAFALAMGVVACSRGQGSTPTCEGASTPTDLHPDVSESATSEQPVPEPPDAEKSPLDPCDAVRRGGELLYTRRTQAREVFTAAADSSALARAYLALMDIEDAASREGTSPTKQAMVDALGALRESYEAQECSGQSSDSPGSVEQEQRAPEDVFACAVYDRYAEFFSDVFSATHYSSRDNMMMLVTRRCVAELLASRLPKARADAVLEAELALRLAALGDGPPRCGGGQYCGSIWHGYMIAAAAPLQQALLAPEALRLESLSSARSAPGEAKIERALETYGAAFARGVCATAAARGQQWSEDKCVEITRRVTLVAHRRFAEALRKGGK